jgi:hypothetical protein
MKDQLIDRRNFWIIISMVLFTCAKIAALICATTIAIKGNIWIGAALFIAAIIFRITWTYLPSKKEIEETKGGETLK